MPLAIKAAQSSGKPIIIPKDPDPFICELGDAISDIRHNSHIGTILCPAHRGPYGVQQAQIPQSKLAWLHLHMHPLIRAKLLSNFFEAKPNLLWPVPGWNQDGKSLNGHEWERSFKMQS